MIDMNTITALQELLVQAKTRNANVYNHYTAEHIDHIFKSDNGSQLSEWAHAQDLLSKALQLVNATIDNATTAGRFNYHVAITPDPGYGLNNETEVRYALTEAIRDSSMENCTKVEVSSLNK